MRLAKWARVASICAAAALPQTAAAASLPKDFIHLSDVDPTIRQDMRYAGYANFLGRPAKGYEGASCILTEKAAKALARVQTALREHGMTLVVFDCYRPAAAVADFASWAREGGPADPDWHPQTRRENLIREGYIASRSAHSRGSTVDLGIEAMEAPVGLNFVDCGVMSGELLDFGTGFDCFDPKSRTASKAVRPVARANRQTLVEAMDKAGFRNYAAEWWHFTLRGEPYPKKIFDFPVTAPER